LGRLNPLPFREVKRRLETAGFIESSQKGSHVKFIRRLGETVDTTIVPRKFEIPVGTLRSILSQAHIDPDDWEKLA
jgi:predicted RNA binding protein YcfA (HicA-like mRNA interferase family)